MNEFDKQLAKYKNELISLVKIPEEYCDNLASQIQKEVQNNIVELKNAMVIASPIEIQNRLDELVSFQSMMDIFNQMKPKPQIVRTQIIVQNYVSFVYLKDTLFEVVRKNSQPNTVLKKVSKFLVNNPVRAFRNSIAHGNWEYKSDFSGLIYYAHKDSKPNEPMTKYEVTQNELGFWQMIARAFAYIVYVEIANTK